MRLAVCVITSNRPKYLSVCLDSIYGNTRIGDIDLFIKINPDPMGILHQKDIIEIVSKFDIRQIFVEYNFKGITKTYFDLFESIFSRGYEYCLILEDDHVLSKHAFDFLIECPKLAFMYSPFRHAEYPTSTEYFMLMQDMGYCWGLMLSSGSFEFMNLLYKANAFNGLWKYRNRYDGNMSGEYISRAIDEGIDVLTEVVAKKYDLLLMIPRIPLLAHIGCRSSFQGRDGLICYEDSIFSGEPNEWLGNVDKVFASISGEESHKSRLIPYNFAYERDYR